MEVSSVKIKISSNINNIPTQMKDNIDIIKQMVDYLEFAIKILFQKLGLEMTLLLLQQSIMNRLLNYESILILYMSIKLICLRYILFLKL